MTRRSMSVLTIAGALLLALFALVGQPQSAQAQRYQLREVGGYGLVVRNTPTFNFGSLDSQVNGQARQGEIVYINGWQIGVYHVGDFRWVAAKDVQPIIDIAGNPMSSNVTRNGNQYYLNGNAITLPGRRVTEAEKFLRNPTRGPVIFNGNYVGIDVPAELIDTTQVRLRSNERVVATMRVTDLYNFIYLRTAPSENAPRASYNAYAGEILTAYEVVGNRWYRIGQNVWAPATWGNETLMVPENVRSYAPQQYYNGGKWISLDLNRQRLTAWEGDDVVISSPIKSGKYGYATPTGTFNILSKVPNERMSGNDYDLLDVSWTMYYTRSAIAIHAAYWHNNYNGRPGSHGCVNVPVDKARDLFMWAPVATTIVAHNAYVYDAQDIADARRWSQYQR